MAFTGRFALNIAQFASEQGGNFEELISCTNSSIEQLCREDYYIESKEYNLLVESAIKATNDEFFGLHSAENLNVSAAGLIAQITQTCSTVKQALEYCCEFASLGCSSLPMTLVELPNEYKLILTPDPAWAKSSPLALRHTTEGVLAFSVKEFHTLTRNKHYPSSIKLPWKSTKKTEEYSRVLGCPVHFEQDEIALFLHKEHVEQNVVTSDYNLLRVLVAHATQKVAQLSNKERFSEIVKRSVLNLVKPEFPTIDQVASHLNIAVRTLQRKLKEDGVSFKSIIDNLKFEYAIDFLKDEALSVKEISYLVGFSNASTFIRFFKGKTGKTPNEYKRDVLKISG